MSENLIITDKDVISITLRFVHNYEVTTEQKDPLRYYDISVLTKKNITCDELMTGIRVGLQVKVGNDMENTEFVDLVFNRYDQSQSLPTYKDFLYKPENDKTDLDIYKSCLKIFYECYKNYYLEQDYVATENPMTKTPLNPIVIKNINFNRFAENFNLEGCFSYQESDSISLYRQFEGNKTLEETGFITSTIVYFIKAEIQKDNEEKSQIKMETGLFKNPVSKAFVDSEVPHYNISETHLFKLDTEPVKIIPPSDPPQKNKGSFIIGLLSSVLMTGAMLLGRSLGTGGNIKSYLPLSICMIGATVIIAWLNKISNDRAHENAKSEWKMHYETYINRIRNEIEDKQQIDINQLNYLYPPNLDLKKAGIEEEASEHDTHDTKYTIRSVVEMAENVSGEVFSRGQEHPEFMKVRIGKSANKSRLVQSVFGIEGEKRDAVFTSARYREIVDTHSNRTLYEVYVPEKNDKKDKSNYLIDLPAHLAAEYQFLKEAPVLLDLKKCGSVGLVFHEEMPFQPFLENFVLNLCFYQSPDDVQFIYFAKSYETYKAELESDGRSPEISKWEFEWNRIRKFKNLPHFKEFTPRVSSIAFNKNDASTLLNIVLEELAFRKENKDTGHNTQIIMIIEEEYDIKRHAVSDYFPELIEGKERPDYGISFLFCKRNEEELPKFCGEVIKCEKKEDVEHWYLIPHVQKIIRNKDMGNLLDLENNENISKDEHDSISSENVLTEIAKEHYEFIPDPFCPTLNDNIYLDADNKRSQYDKSFNIISSLYYDRIEQGAGIPGSKTLFELIKDSDRFKMQHFLDDINSLTKDSVEELGALKERISKYIEDNWKNADSLRNVQKTLSVDIGYKEENGLVELDLHEKKDGPHMLVAGTTGSGKTESILTYLIMLCLLYTPKQVNLLLMDMKGAGFVKRIGNLPHVVGKVTDIDGDENGTSMEYTLKRFLKSMDSEIKIRKQNLSQMEVDSIDSYVKAQNNIEDHIKNVAKLNPDKYTDPEKKREVQRKIDRMRELVNEPMPHLFVVIDEFTELMRFSGENSDIDFKAQITSLARIGRSLGYHIILISQNIEGAITDDIRVNSKARFCLKVATRQASKEMIGTDLAASPLMPGNGRAYLLIGTGSRRDYFQTAYSGAPAIYDSDREIALTEFSRSGAFTDFYNSKIIKEAISKNEFEDKILEKVLESDKVRKINPDLTVNKAKKTNDDINPGTGIAISNPENHGTTFEMDSKESTQIQILAEVITKYAEDNGYMISHKVFQELLPSACYFDFDNNKEVKIESRLLKKES